MLDPIISPGPYQFILTSAQAADLILEVNADGSGTAYLGIYLGTHRVDVVGVPGTAMVILADCRRTNIGFSISAEYRPGFPGFEFAFNKLALG